MSTLQTASVVPEGKLRFTAGLEVLDFAGQDSSNTGSASLTVPQVEGSLRYGLGGGLDFGIKAWLLGVEIDLKKELFNNGNAVFSGAFGLGYSGISVNNGSGNSSSISQLTGYLPLLYGIKFGDGNEFIIGPKVVDTIFFANDPNSSSTVNVLWVGGSVGVAFKLGQYVRLMPELNVMYPLYANGAYSTGGDTRTSSGSGGLWWIQGGLGFLFGE